MELQITPQDFLLLISDYFNDSEINNIMEIGSLDGKDSLIFKERFPNATVYCIEGLLDNYNLYLKNLKDIITINMVIANYDGVINYHKKNINGIHGILNRGNKYGTEVLKNIECKTFFTLCGDYNIKNVDVVKIDVEGATYEVLIGMGNMIKNIKIMHIETESYPFFEGQKLHDDVCNLLIANEFKLIKLTNVNIINDDKQHDSVWVNKKYINEERVVNK